MAIFKDRKELKDSSKTDIVGLDEALAKISLELMNPEEEKLFTVTDVTPEEVFGIASLLAYADMVGSEKIKAWLKYFLLLRVSRFRTGRKEFMLIGSGLLGASEKKGGSKSVKDLFAGIG